MNIIDELRRADPAWAVPVAEPERALRLRAAEEIVRLREALRDCMSYVDVDNLTMQTKERNWQAVLQGKPWNSANVEIITERPADG